MESDSTLLGIALIERILLEDVDGIRYVVGAIGPEHLAEVMQFLGTIVATTLVQDHGLVGAVERVHDWRSACLAGMAARDA